MKAHPVLPLICAVSIIGALNARRPLQCAARCFTVDYGPWSVGDEPLSVHEPLTRSVALLDSVFSPAADGHPVEYWAVRLSGGLQERRRAQWYHTGKDSIAIMLPSRWSTGIQLSLPAAGDTLDGRAEIYVDYTPYRPTWAAVIAIRTSCPSTLRLP